METRPRLLDLCSGIGGFSLAASWLGIDTIGFCEIDPWCQRVLARNFPGVPIHDDLKTLTGTIVRGWLGGQTVHVQSVANSDGIGRISGSGTQRQDNNCAVEQRQPTEDQQPGSERRDWASEGYRHRLDIVTAGYPCQPFSHAGKRLGTEDDRHLWPHIARLVAELRPRYCLFENVAGHISLGLDDVLSDLEALGYACRPVVVPACAVNAPHRRDRVWIVADAECQSEPEPGYQAEAECDQRDTRMVAGGGGSRRPSNGIASHVANAEGLHGRGKSVRVAAPYAESGGSDNPRQRQTLSGLGDSPDGLPRRLAGPLNAWTGDWEAGVSRTTDKEADRVNKLKALGNAIVPLVAYVILSSMLAAA